MILSLASWTLYLVERHVVSNNHIAENGNYELKYIKRHHNIEDSFRLFMNKL